MDFEIELKDTDELFGWQDVFRVLGVKRCYPVLSKAGLPVPMVVSPDALMHSSLHFWNVSWQDRQPKQNGRLNIKLRYGTDGESILLRTRQLVKEIFTTFADIYDLLSANELYNWALRHFVDRVQVNRWTIWATLFLRLSEETVDSLWYKAPPLSIGVSDRIKKIVWLHLSNSAQEQDLQLLTMAGKIPLSPTEQRMLELEVSKPLDSAQMNILLHLKLLLRRQHAYLAWSEISEWLEESDRQILLKWGREQPDIPANLVSLPHN